MKIFISDIDRQNARSIALKNISRFFGISDWELKSNTKLKSELDKINDPEVKTIIRLLDKYFAAYDNWYKFYQNKKAIEAKENRDYELNQKDQIELQELIKSREKTLSKLQNEFDRLQLKRFHQNKFGSNISGTINEDT